MYFGFEIVVLLFDLSYCTRNHGQNKGTHRILDKQLTFLFSPDVFPTLNINSLFIKLNTLNTFAHNWYHIGGYD